MMLYIVNKLPLTLDQKGELELYSVLFADCHLSRFSHDCLTLHLVTLHKFDMKCHIPCNNEQVIGNNWYQMIIGMSL
jgi:hypothetical protein